MPTIELEIDLVQRIVAFERGEVDVEVEPAGGAVEEPCGGAPPCTAVVVVGEDDGVGPGSACRPRAFSLWRFALEWLCFVC